MNSHQALSQLFQQALALHQRGEWQQAQQLYEKILRQMPGQPDTLHYLGLLKHQQGESRQALPLLQQAAQQQPNDADLQFNLGVVWQALGDLAQASQSYQRCIQRNPKFAMAYNNQGNCQEFQGNSEKAERLYQQAQDIDPNCIPALNNYANILKKKGLVSKAEQLYQRALKLQPNYTDALSNLAGIYQRQGKIALAHDYYQKTLQLDPRHDSARSGLLLNLNYGANLSRQAVFAWHKQLCATLDTQPSCKPSSTSKHTRLRIAYLSPDFNTHSVAYFALPILRHHDHSRFEIFAYANQLRDDEMTQQLKSQVDHWHPISNMSDAQVVELICQHEIDILVDLAGHTARNRLAVLAKKPARIQVNYLGYPNTLGLSTIDYRLVDAVSDPDHLGNENFHVEKLMRLPHGFLCYSAPQTAPLPNDAPFEKNGYITFGSFNNTAKINEQVIAAWANILQQTPNAKLMLKSSIFHDEAICESYRQQFAQRNVAADRLQLMGHINDTQGHLAIYQQVDIALDTFPYNGTTTSCEAMWMGVPLITLAGETHASRVGASLLTQLGLEDLITGDVEHYVELARRLANDKECLKQLRKELRPLMQQSSLMNGESFTADLESMYLKMAEEKGVI